MKELTYTALGKEVLCKGAHHADATTPEAAQIIANALNILEIIAGAYVATPTDTARAEA